MCYELTWDPTAERHLFYSFAPALKAVGKDWEKGGVDNQGEWRQCVTHVQVPY